MTKNTRLVWLFSLGGALALLVIFVGRDIYLRRQNCFDCGDGKRCTIDLRDFTTQYSAYSLELEGKLGAKVDLTAKLSPVQVQKLSDAIQSAREFRQFVVAGYNSCAVNKQQYAVLGARFRSGQCGARNQRSRQRRFAVA